MNDETRHSEQPIEDPRGSASPDATSGKRMVNPNLSGNLTADYAALQNDLVQATELAADFQRQLAGKSNEHAQLKQIFEKSQADLAHLQDGIVELRAERHRLANEAMRATALEAKLAKVSAERDHLRADMEVLLQAQARKSDEMTFELRDRDRHIAELVVEMVSLKQALQEAKGELPAVEEIPLPTKVSPVKPSSPASSVLPELDFDGEDVAVEIVSARSEK